MNDLALLQSRYPKGIIPLAANLGLPPEKKLPQKARCSAWVHIPTTTKADECPMISKHTVNYPPKPNQFADGLNNSYALDCWLPSVDWYIIISGYAHINQYMWRSMSLTSSVS